MFCGLIVDGALIGLIVAFMDRGEWPGWPQAIGSALAVGLATTGASYVLPEELWLLAFPAGAVVGGLVIHYLCELSVRSSAIAAGIYLGLRIVFALIMMWLVS